jgi:uncharacterized protein (DUF2252 family)
MTHGFVVLARPEGFEHAPRTIVIKGVEESVEALRAAWARSSGRETGATSQVIGSSRLDTPSSTLLIRVTNVPSYVYRASEIA